MQAGDKRRVRLVAAAAVACAVGGTAWWLETERRAESAALRYVMAAVEGYEEPTPATFARVLEDRGWDVPAEGVEQPTPVHIACAVADAWLLGTMAATARAGAAPGAAATALRVDPGPLVAGEPREVRGWQSMAALLVVGAEDGWWLRSAARRLGPTFKVGLLVSGESEEAVGGVFEAAREAGLMLYPAPGEEVARYLDEVESHPTLVRPREWWCLDDLDWPGNPLERG